MSRTAHGGARPPPPRTRPPPSPHLNDEDDEEQQRHTSHSSSSSSSSSSSAAFDSTGKHKSFSLVSSLRLFYLRSPVRAALLLLVLVGGLVGLAVWSYSSNTSFSLSTLQDSFSLRTSPLAASHAADSHLTSLNATSSHSTQPCPPSPTTAASSNSLFLDPAIPLSTLSIHSSNPITIDRLIYTTATTSPSSLPQFIQSFRQGHLDWHRLLPTIPSTSSSALDFEHLVASERATTKLLVWDYNLHTQWGWGKEHGPLAAYTLCPVIGDRCLIHNENECSHNGLCGWCSSTNQCVDRFNAANPYDAQHAGNCPTPLPAPPVAATCESGKVLHVSGGQMREYDGGVSAVERGGGKCSHIVKDRYLFIDLNNNAQAMYYHFITEFLQGFYSAHYSRNAEGREPNTYVHLLGRQGNFDQYHDIFGVFSSFCPRYANQFTSNDICLCPQLTAGSTASGGNGELVQSESLVDHMVKSLGLEDVRPVPQQPSLVLISRQYKRFILNELDLIYTAIHKYGFSARLLPIEFMTLYEQVREFRRTNVLAGIHGSGLTNYLFLHGSNKELNGINNVGLQLMPWKVTTGSTFFSGFATSSGANYKEYSNNLRSNAVFHTHFLNEQENKQIESVLSNGATGGGGNFFAFWINQDTIIDMVAWEKMLQEILDGFVPVVPKE